MSLLNSKPLEIFLSTYAQTSEAYNLHLEQKIAKCSTYERRFGHFTVPEQFLGRQARLVPFLPIAILYFENLQLYRLRLGMTGSVALSCKQNNQHEYYLRGVVSPRWTLRHATRERQTTASDRLLFYRACAPTWPLRQTTNDMFPTCIRKLINFLRWKILH